MKVSMCVRCDGVDSTLWYIFLLISAGVQCSVWTCGQNEWRDNISTSHIMNSRKIGSSTFGRVDQNTEHLII